MSFAHPCILLQSKLLCSLILLSQPQARQPLWNCKSLLPFSLLTLAQLVNLLLILYFVIYLCNSS